jgi:hypothetical protein
MSAAPTKRNVGLFFYLRRPSKSAFVGDKLPEFDDITARYDAHSLVSGRLIHTVRGRSFDVLSFSGDDDGILFSSQDDGRYTIDIVGFPPPRQAPPCLTLYLQEASSFCSHLVRLVLLRHRFGLMTEFYGHGWLRLSKLWRKPPAMTSFWVDQGSHRDDLSFCVDTSTPDCS